MKRIFTLIIAFTAFTAINAQETATPAPEVIKLKETAHDFGKIPQGKPVFHNFEVTNTGSEPMVIINIQTTCGCTTPEWTKGPIAPGATSIVKVGYNAATEGAFEKYITILYNQNLSKQVKITGSVWRAPENPAPLNASVQLLKQKNQ
jgi:hypothetical protein